MAPIDVYKRQVRGRLPAAPAHVQKSGGLRREQLHHPVRHHHRHGPDQQPAGQLRRGVGVRVRDPFDGHGHCDEGEPDSDFHSGGHLRGRSAHHRVQLRGQKLHAGEKSPGHGAAGVRDHRRGGVSDLPVRAHERGAAVRGRRGAVQRVRGAGLPHFSAFVPP